MNNLLRFIGPRPVWDPPLLRMGLQLLNESISLSPIDYPHAAEDLATACRLLGTGTLARREPAREAADDGTRPRVGVFSSISPWVELTLLSACARHAAIVCS